MNISVPHRFHNGCLAIASACLFSAVPSLVYAQADTRAVHATAAQAPQAAVPLEAGETHSAGPDGTTHGITQKDPSKPHFSHEFNFKYYFSPSAGVKDGNTRVGDTTLQRYSYDYRLHYTASEGLTLMAGVYGNYMSLNNDSGVPLPSHLQALGFLLGSNRDLTHIFGRGWSSMLMLRPILTTDSSSFSDPGFVLQGGWLLNYRQNESMIWTGGVVFSTHAEISALPVVGLRWHFAEDWSTFIGFPEASVSYQIMEDLKLMGLVTFHQGSYKMNSAPHPGVNGTYLDYRELRLGLGAEYEVIKGLVVGIDGGAVVDRRFNYYQRDFMLKGEAAAYMNVSVNFVF